MVNFLCMQHIEVKDQPNHNSSLLSFTVTIPSLTISHEGSTKHCNFVLDVRCKHSHASVEEHWTTHRRYRDFQDIDLTLRNQVCIVHSTYLFRVVDVEMKLQGSLGY